MTNSQVGAPLMNILDAWAEYMSASGASPNTVETRVWAMKSLMSNAGVIRPELLNRMHVLTWLASQQKQWTKVTYWSCVKAFDDWVVEFDLGESQLTKGIPRPRTPDAVARPITDETIDALLALTLPRRANAYVRLALYHALRVHEIAKIRGEELDLEAGWQLVAGKGGVVKPIPIHAEIAKLAETMPEFGWWFPSRSGEDRPIAPQSVTQTIGSALRAVGSRATAHQLRDTAATRFQREHKDIRLTQAYLRHKALSSSMKYTAVSDSALQAAVASINWSRKAA